MLYTLSFFQWDLRIWSFGLDSVSCLRLFCCACVFKLLRIFFCMWSETFLILLSFTYIKAAFQIDISDFTTLLKKGIFQNHRFPFFSYKIIFYIVEMFHYPSFLPIYLYSGYLWHLFISYQFLHICLLFHKWTHCSKLM